MILVSEFLSRMLGIEKCCLTFDRLSDLCLGLCIEDIDECDAIVKDSLASQILLSEIPRAVDDVQAFI